MRKNIINAGYGFTINQKNDSVMTVNSSITGNVYIYECFSNTFILVNVLWENVKNKQIIQYGTLQSCR